MFGRANTNHNQLGLGQSCRACAGENRRIGVGWVNAEGEVHRLWDAPGVYAPDLSDHPDFTHRRYSL
jgi:hypothetical protein